jgi:hypothetical protein
VSIQGTFDGNYVENQEGGGGGVYIERVDTEVFVNAEFMCVWTEARGLEGWAKGEEEKYVFVNVEFTDGRPGEGGGKGARRARFANVLGTRLYCKE